MPELQPLEHYQAAPRGEGRVNRPGIIVALDFPTGAEAENCAARLHPRDCRLKVGLELFTAEGPQLIERLQARGFEIFLDLKFHDIPNTVAQACARAAALGVWMLNVHALGGPRMLAAARAAVTGATKLIAVTILTSHDEADLAQVGLGPAASTVTRLANLAAEAGLDGVVCSGHEASRLRAQHGADFLLVTPGIRPATADRQDQRRVMTPTEAAAAGASHLVIGRPITAASDPAQAVTAVANELVTGSAAAH